ncbi:hypothetical protein PVAP13_2NG206544 [Panicum virgatum]|uniref:Uncharacterized protein n=1 Tax=Panicum virgatum TaxID=38727 RepID=A0A8T0V3S7_PANVG|nr:hypothetical protein PVAP13_2NG206544 [Panicum virgatum]
MATSAVVQETVSRVSSFIFNKHEEKVSKGHNLERLEMAHTELELAIERSSKLPITDVALLRRRKILKRALNECGDVLLRYKLQAIEDEESQQGVMVTHPSFPKRIAYATKSSIAHLFGLAKDGPSGLDVQRFEWFAGCAGKLVKDLESGCSLWQYTFSNPLTRQLLEGKTLWYEMEKGTIQRGFFISPICFEDRGLEAALAYRYKDQEMPEKNFRLALNLRLSESTDIVGYAIKCLQPLTSQFKVVAEFAKEELTLLPNLQDISHSFAPPAIIQESYTEITQSFRPDPLCCKTNGQRPFANNIMSSELAHIFPEQVIGICLTPNISALEYSFHSSIDGASRYTVTYRPPPLEFAACFIPHLLSEGVQKNYVVERLGGKIEHKNGASIQQTSLREQVRPKPVEGPVPGKLQTGRSMSHSLFRVVFVS